MYQEVGTSNIFVVKNVENYYTYINSWFLGPGIFHELGILKWRVRVHLTVSQLLIREFIKYSFTVILILTGSFFKVHELGIFMK